MHKVSRRNILVSFGSLISGSVIQSVVKIIVLGILARILSPGEFGIYNAVAVVIGFVHLFNELGVGAAIIQKKEITNLTKSTGFYLSFILGLCLTLTLYITSSDIAKLFKIPQLQDLLKVCSILFFLESFSIASKGLLQRDMKFKMVVAIELIAFVLGYALLGTILAFLGYSYWSLVYATIAQTSIQSILFMWGAKVPFFSRFCMDECKALLSFGTGFTLARVFNYLALNTDNFIVSRFMGAAQLGIYGRGYQLMVFPSTLIGSALDKVLFSTFSRLGYTDPKTMSSYYISSLRISLLVASIISALIFFNAELVVRVLLGETWLEVIGPLQILSLGLAFRLSYKMNISIIRAKGKVYLYALSQLLYFFAVLGGVFIVRNTNVLYIAAAVTIAIFINYIITLSISIYLNDGRWVSMLKLHGRIALFGLIIWGTSYTLAAIFSNYGLDSNLLLTVQAFLNTIILTPILLIDPFIRGFVRRVLWKK